MLGPILKGMATTFKYLFQAPITIKYPDVERPVRNRFKGRHHLNRYDNGENTDDERYSPGERYASTYEINMLRCIYCGYCEDACPTEAIVLGKNYELSLYDRESAIYTKEMLILPVQEGGTDVPQQVPPGSFDRSIPDMENPR